MKLIVKKESLLLDYLIEELNMPRIIIKQQNIIPNYIQA